MSRREALLLRVTCLWTFFVWGVFVKNQIGDDTRSTGFKVVHFLLAVVSIGLAVAVWGVTTRSRRRHGEKRSVSP